SRHAFVDANLANYYQLETVEGDEEFVATQLEQSRAGLLARGGILAREGFNQTAPILRGHWVREHLLCDLVPEAPENVDNVPPPFEEGQTTRERTTARTSGGCANCHTLMNDIGFGFEHFDAAGQWRDNEEGRPIDASGFVSESDVGAFDGLQELQELLADSESLTACFARQLFRQATGRLETHGDLDDLEALRTTIEESNGSYRHALLAATELRAFLNQGEPQ
ncbi:MAG: DUF1588 domain-containing protein, partial [Myxococcota bacterium]